MDLAITRSKGLVTVTGTHLSCLSNSQLYLFSLLVFLSHRVSLYDTKKATSSSKGHLYQYKNLKVKKFLFSVVHIKPQD